MDHLTSTGSWDQALAREAKKRSSGDVKPVIVQSINDIKRVIAEYAPARSKSDDVTVSATFSADQPVSAKSRSLSKRDIIIEGIRRATKITDITNAISNVPGVTVNGVTMRPPALSDDGTGNGWVDKAINRWFGGQRRGTDICWDLPDGYTY